MESELPISIGTYMATLEALHLVDSPASIDALLDLYDAQVLAFYDPVGHVYYSLDTPPGDILLPAAMVDAVVVHELVHALQDQAFDAGNRTVELQSNWDAALAYQSVLEGEALLVMIAHLGERMGVSLDDLITQESIVAAVRESAAAGMNVPTDVPAYFVESLKFPYVEGLAFVLDAYTTGGWDAVDAVHHDPPRSTEEIIHPEVYRQRITAGGAAGDSSRSQESERVVETVLGEFHWSFLLGRDAGEGWASDGVTVRHEERGTTVLLDSTWDDEQQAEEFEAAYREYLERMGAPNCRIARRGERVKAAYGADARSIRVFVRAKNAQ
jgi:hypothetical protein